MIHLFISALRRFSALAAIAGTLALAQTTSAQTAPGGSPSPPPAAAVQTGQKSLMDVYKSGGLLMHFILLCSVGTIAAVVYCFVAVNPGRMMPKTSHHSMVQFARHRDVNAAYQLSEQNPSAYAKVVGPALLKVNFERDHANKGSMEQAAGDALDREETRQMAWVNYLNVFATLAPMLGLLGTVTGMIASFDQLAAGRSEPADLAGGIGEAMITTAGGLFVGIPAMFFYFFFKNRLTSIMSDVQKNAAFVIDILSGEVALAEDDARSA